MFSPLQVRIDNRLNGVLAGVVLATALMGSALVLLDPAARVDNAAPLAQAEPAPVAVAQAAEAKPASN